MAQWQMQCCGQPFEVGSEIQWTLGVEAGDEFLSGVLGADTASSITHYEDHHGDLPDDVPATRGVVRGIRAVRCRYEDRREERTLYPVPGSATFEAVKSADGWDEDRGDHRFLGYLIELEAR